MNASNVSLFSLVPQDRATLDTSGADLIVVAEFQDIQLAGAPKRQQALDGLVWDCRVIINKNCLELLVEAAKILFIEIRDGAGYHLVHAQDRIAPLDGVAIALVLFGLGEIGCGPDERIGSPAGCEIS